MDSERISKTVRELLDKLVNDLPGYRWDALYLQAPGKDKTMMELNIWRNDGQETAGRIAYQLETGTVLNYHYPPIGQHAPEPVVDFLLDLYNFERLLVEANRTF